LFGCDFIITGNTHCSKFLEALHINYFLDFLNKNNVKKIFIISGNHDSHINYQQYNSKILSSDFFEFKFLNVNTAFISYDASHKRNFENLQQYDIIFTHTEQNNLKRFNSKILVSGHTSVGFSSNILQINIFPCSFCTVDFFKNKIDLKLLKLCVCNDLVKIETRIAKTYFLTKEKA